MSSLIEDLIRDTIPALLAAFSEQSPVFFINNDGEESAVKVVIQNELMRSGEYEERVESVTTIECDARDNAQIGNIWTVEPSPTTDDPYPDSIIYRAEQIITDDGLTRKFLVRKVVND